MTTDRLLARMGGGVSGLRSGLALGIIVAALCPAAAAANDYRYSSAGADLPTSLRTCTVGVSLFSRDDSLAPFAPNTNSAIHTATSSSCTYMAGQPNPSLIIDAMTYEEVVDAAPRLVRADSCVNDPNLTFYCATDSDYFFGLQGVKYEAVANFTIQLPANETFTTVPTGCTLSNPAVRHLVRCKLNTSLVTHSVTDG